MTASEATGLHPAVVAAIRLLNHVRDGDVEAAWASLRPAARMKMTLGVIQEPATIAATTAMTPAERLAATWSAVEADDRSPSQQRIWHAFRAVANQELRHLLDLPLWLDRTGNLGISTYPRPVTVDIEAVTFVAADQAEQGRNSGHITGMSILVELVDDHWFIASLSSDLPAFSSEFVEQTMLGV